MSKVLFLEGKLCTRFCLRLICDFSNIFQLPIIWHLVRQLVPKVHYTKYQVPLYLWRIKPMLKQCALLQNIISTVGLNTNVPFILSSALFLTISRRRLQSYRNQSIVLPLKSLDWFLYDRDLGPKRVKPRTMNL